ncbi:spore coat protein C [Bacillus gaemokensis]|nr:UbiA prenyltransferase family protein [Bacillus gaemokensis]KYG39532.1 spore coat protein C [Bacillus gaemokensis]
MTQLNKSITKVALLLTSILSVIFLFLYFTYNGTPWKRQTAISESENYIVKHFALDAKVKDTSYNHKMDSYEISFETNEDGNFIIEYKGPNRFDISPAVQEYLNKYSKFAQ